MTSDPSAQDVRQKKPKTARARSWQTGRDTFKLMAQHKCAADPISYAVWYTFVDGKNKAVTAAIDRLIADARGISAADLRQIHDLHIAENRQAEEQLEGISQAIQTEVAGAKSLVSDVISNTNNYVSSMDRAKGLIPKASSPEDIMEALDELMEETQSSQESAQNIQFALQSTHDEMTQLSSKVGELRDTLKRDPLTALVNQPKFEALLAENSTEALANGYSLTVMVVCIKNLQDLSLTAGIDISEFVLKSLSGFLTKIVADDGVCARLAGPELAIMLPKSAYAEASKIAKAIIEELDHFKIVKKPSDELIGYIRCAFGGSSLQSGLSPRDLIEIAADQASQAKYSHKSIVKFDLTNHQAA
ncbi:MAG: diguanylate cyclase [Pseudomonadota bacterium]